MISQDIHALCKDVAKETSQWHRGSSEDREKRAFVSFITGPFFSLRIWVNFFCRSCSLHAAGRPHGSVMINAVPRFLQVVAGVDVHPLDHGPMRNLQGGQTHGKVRLPRQNNWEWYIQDWYIGEVCVCVCVHINITGRWKHEQKDMNSLFPQGGNLNDIHFFLPIVQKMGPKKGQLIMLTIAFCKSPKAFEPF